MDQFAWTKEEALYYMGILMSAGAVIACATFVAIGPLCKRYTILTHITSRTSRVLMALFLL